MSAALPSIAIPPALAWLRDGEGGRAWLARLPELAAAAAARWSLELGPVFPDGQVSLVMGARRRAGGEAVLKLQFPHPECEHEADALALWAGEGAVRLLAHDAADHALLLERARPGHPLRREEPGRALDVLVSLLPRLWKPAGEPFRTLADESAHWRRSLLKHWEATGRPFERRLLDAARETLAALGGSQSERVLLHQDLHPDNVLAASREPWLAIDPKPLAGERAFSAAPIVRAPELGHGRAEVLGRLERLSGALGLDRERARGWAFAQTLAWAFGPDGARPQHVETARWLLDARL